MRQKSPILVLGVAMVLATGAPRAENLVEL